jgi:hypothetical protein
MPLFGFEYQDSEEFVFDGGKYALKKFFPKEEISQEILETGIFSNRDINYIRLETWALVAENPEIETYRREINILLLSFKIYKLSRLFIRYRLCKENIRLCSRLCVYLKFILEEKSPKEINLHDLKAINEGYSNLLRMNKTSNRTYNAIYFLYRAYHSEKWIESFILMMSALESLFSSERHENATNTICSRVSAFLDSKARCRYKDISKLYDLRSKMVHGRIKVDKDEERHLKRLHELEYVATKCMKKILNDKIYLIYADDEQKEDYFDKIVSNVNQ